MSRRKRSTSILMETIDELFKDMGPNEINQLVIDFDEFIMEMFHISKIDGHKIELTHEFEDRKFYPVIFPDKLLDHIRLKDTFLITIARLNNQWHVLYMSHPYF